LISELRLFSAFFHCPGALLLELLTDLQQLGEQSTQKALAVGGFGS